MSDEDTMFGAWYDMKPHHGYRIFSGKCGMTQSGIRVYANPLWVNPILAADAYTEPLWWFRSARHKLTYEDESFTLFLRQSTVW